MSLKKSFITILVLSLSLIYIGCNTPKEEKTPPQKKVEKIPPGHAKINGEIVKILPIDKKSNGPCSKTPCLAMVKVTGATYGAGFPVLNMNENIKINFKFTLAPTSKELFPNMEESYPGLNEGQKFTALLSFVNLINQTEPSFQIYGYSIN